MCLPCNQHLFTFKTAPYYKATTNGNHARNTKASPHPTLYPQALTRVQNALLSYPSTACTAVRTYKNDNRHPNERPLSFRASCRIRTNDPEITNHVLWPTELKRRVGKLLTSHRYNQVPLLRSRPGGFRGSWSCKTCPYFVPMNKSMRTYPYFKSVAKVRIFI